MGRRSLVSSPRRAAWQRLKLSIAFACTRKPGIGSRLRSGRSCAGKRSGTHPSHHTGNTRNSRRWGSKRTLWGPNLPPGPFRGSGNGWSGGLTGSASTPPCYSHITLNCRVLRPTVRTHSAISLHWTGTETCSRYYQMPYGGIDAGLRSFQLARSCAAGDEPRAVRRDRHAHGAGRST